MNESDDKFLAQRWWIFAIFAFILVFVAGFTFTKAGKRAITNRFETITGDSTDAGATTEPSTSTSANNSTQTSGKTTTGAGTTTGNTAAQSNTASEDAENGTPATFQPRDYPYPVN